MTLTLNELTSYSRFPYFSPTVYYNIIDSRDNCRENYGFGNPITTF